MFELELSSADKNNPMFENNGKQKKNSIVCGKNSNDGCFFFVAKEYDILNIQPCVNVFHCPLEVETFKLTSTLAPWALTLLLAKSIQIYLQTKHID